MLPEEQFGLHSYCAWDLKGIVHKFGQIIYSAFGLRA